MIILLIRLWHEYVLLHDVAWSEINPRAKRTRKWGTVVECTCGRRWLSRAPWDRMDLPMGDR